MSVEIVGQRLRQGFLFLFDQNLKQTANIRKNGILEYFTHICLLGVNISHLDSRRCGYRRVVLDLRTL